jgi:hypothetical protein
MGIQLDTNFNGSLGIDDINSLQLPQATHGISNLAQIEGQVAVAGFDLPLGLEERFISESLKDNVGFRYDVRIEMVGNVISYIPPVEIQLDEIKRVLTSKLPKTGEEIYQVVQKLTEDYTASKGSNDVSLLSCWVSRPTDEKGQRGENISRSFHIDNAEEETLVFTYRGTDYERIVRSRIVISIAGAGGTEIALPERQIHDEFWLNNFLENKALFCTDNRAENARLKKQRDEIIPKLEEGLRIVTASGQGVEFNTLTTIHRASEESGRTPRLVLRIDCFTPIQTDTNSRLNNQLECYEATDYPRRWASRYRV